MRVFGVLLSTIFIGIIKVTKPISTGARASPGDFPYQVSINCYGEFQCGGVIIDTTHVLTAAHCVYTYDASVITVNADLVDIHDPHAVSKTVQQVHLHPNFTNSGYDPITRQNLERLCSKKDIAVLQINEAYVWRQRIAAAPLPTRSFNEYSYKCTMCYFAGWGKDEVPDVTIPRHLQYIRMAILPRRDCVFGAFIPDWVQFCAMDIFQESVTLPGDSGGPLVCDGELVGILSAGNSVPGDPSVFINLQRTLDFINTVLNNSLLIP